MAMLNNQMVNGIYTATYGNPGIEKVGKLETMKSRSSINIQENLVYVFGEPPKNRND
jgi:hypothetical protein